MTEAQVRATTYDVSVWPDDIECIDSDTWKLTVEYRGDGLWAVCLRSLCLSAGEEWEREPRPSERDGEWLAQHRFAFHEAVRLAARHAPNVTVNGMTATEVLERHRQRHPDGKCRP